MTFSIARTDTGRLRTTCGRCGDSKSSWSARLLSQWQRSHHCLQVASAAS